MTKFLLAHFIDNFCYDDNLSINSYHFKIILEYNYFSLHFYISFCFNYFFEMLTVKRMTKLAIIADVLNYVLNIMFIIIISWKVTIL